MANRRSFISGSIATVLGLGTLGSNTFSNEIATVPLPKNEDKKKELIYPRVLTPGSTIAITAPASPTNQYEIRHATKLLKSLGCKVEIGKTITDHNPKNRYFSASDDQRLNELMGFFEREDVDGIIAARGGYGVMRILDQIDFDLIRKNPKVIVGFSDITALLNPIYTLSGLVSFHGPVASSTFNRFTTENFKKVLFEGEVEKGLNHSHTSATTINGGIAEGKLVGGNLKMIVSTLQTPFEIDTENSILFLEDIDEHPYKIDRMLTQLKLSGKLDNVKGFLLGQFSGVNKRHPFYPNTSFTLKEVIDQILTPLEKPIVLGMPFGHVKDKLTLPIGVDACLDADKKSISLNEKPVLG